VDREAWPECWAERSGGHHAHAETAGTLKSGPEGPLIVEKLSGEHRDHHAEFRIEFLGDHVDRWVMESSEKL